MQSQMRREYLRQDCSLFEKKNTTTIKKLFEKFRMREENPRKSEINEKTTRTRTAPVRISKSTCAYSRDLMRVWVKKAKIANPRIP